MHPTGKVAIVTGAGTGIGKAVALALLKEGYAVALAGRRAEPLENAIARTGAGAERTLAVPTDVSDPASVRGAVREDEGELRPARPAVQQRRHRRARRSRSRI